MAGTGHARDYTRVATNYAKSIVKGKAKVGKKTFTPGKLEIAQCQRFLDDLDVAKKEKKKKDKSKRRFWFDPWEGNNACDFIEKLQHVKGVWDNPYLFLEPSQVFIVLNLFGFRKIRRGRDARRFTDAYMEMARKNAKSTLLAGIQLYCLVGEEEQGPEVYSAATTGDQARAVWDVAKGMILKDPELAEFYGLECLANSIICHSNGGYWKPINNKASTKDGLNPHCAGLDELHAHKDRSLHDVLKSAFKARHNPLFLRITTAGYILDGVCYEQRTLVEKLLTGVLKDNLDHYFGVIFTLDKKDDPYDPRNWRKANPLLGVSVHASDLAEYASEAKVSPQSEGEFFTKHLNLWLNAASALIPMAQWEDCKEEFDLELFRGRECRIGGDLADFDDIASVVIACEIEGIEYWYDFHYLPEDLVKERAHTVTDHYMAWAKCGDVILTPGDWIDENRIEQDVRNLMDEFEIIASVDPRVRFDQYGSAIAMAGRMTNDGYPVEIYKKNAANYTNPTKSLLARLKVGRFKHRGSAVLKWMASNVVGDQRTDGSVLPKKETKHSKNKIDGIDAGLLALSFLTDEEAVQSAFAKGSLWDDA